MLHHLELLLGTVGAVEAAEWQLISVGEVVVAEAGRPAETLPAHGAHIRPLLAVLLLVRLE